MQVPCAYRKIIFYICGGKSQHHSLGAGKLGAAASSGGAVSVGAAAGFFLFDVGYRDLNVNRRAAAGSLGWHRNFSATSLPINLRCNFQDLSKIFWSSIALSTALSSAPASSTTLMQLSLLKWAAYSRAVWPFLHLALTLLPCLSSSKAAFAEPCAHAVCRAVALWSRYRASRSAPCLISNWSISAWSYRAAT